VTAKLMDPPVMLMLFAVNAVVSAGALLVAFGKTRSSPVCGTPTGLQFVAVVNVVVVPTHVRVRGPVLMTRFLFAPSDPAAPGEARGRCASSAVPPAMMSLMAPPFSDSELVAA